MQFLHERYFAFVRRLCYVRRLAPRCLSGSRRPRSSVSRTLQLAAFALAIAVPSTSFAQVNLQGEWRVVNPDNWFSRTLMGNNLAPGTAAHFALLRGKGDSTRVLYWYDRHTAQLWPYNPATGADGPSLTLPAPASHLIDCGGQSALADGRLLVTGGLAQMDVAGAVIGNPDASVFDPKGTLGLSSAGWALQTPMRYGRWYPTNTTLGDGSVLVSSGLDHFRLVTFGGTGDNEEEFDDWGLLDLEKDPKWWADNAALEIPRCGARPGPRVGHSANFVGAQGNVVFGGLDSTGLVLNDLWVLKRHDEDPAQPNQETWFWCPLTVVGELPEPRHRHGAGVVGNTLYVFGGQRQDGTALGDLWKIDLAQDEHRWELVTAGGDVPTARFGHTATRVAADSTGTPAMLVFGGRDELGYKDSTVFALSFAPVPTWFRAAEGGPTPREGHVAVWDPVRSRMLMFGGRSLTQIDTLPAVEALENDLWALVRFGEGQDVTWSWEEQNPASTCGMGGDSCCCFPNPCTCGDGPPARTRATAIYDDQWDRILIYGGQTETGISSGIWELGFHMGGASWRPIPSQPGPAARYGHTAVYDIVPVYARVLERFLPSTGQWQALDSAPRVQPYYPQMFLLGNGDVFWDGNSLGGTSFILTNPTLAIPTWHSPLPSGFEGGSAVMYLPNRIMKCGGGYLTPDNRAAIIDLNSGSPAWTNLPLIPEARTFHNLTILPTGQVLLTGGTNGAPSPGPGDFYYSPRIWDPNNLAQPWGTTLAPEPIGRGYHSSAMLLPDGRILASAGQPSPLGATIYSPPYLFNSSGQPATRPVIQSLTKNKFLYNETFNITAPNAAAIRNVCLIKPGSVTHGFNHDQRYVPLSFTRSGSSKLIVTSPLNANAAPPGDYMLFIVNTTTPSIARWVRLGGAVNQYPFDVTVQGNGTVGKSPDQATYSDGSIVRLTATPAVGIRFAGWSGNASGTTNPLNVTVDGAMAVTATFDPNLCGNSGFETNLNGWMTYGSCALTRVAGGRSGGFSMEIRASSSTAFGCDDNPNWVTTVAGLGRTYRFTAWVRSVAHLGKVRIRIYEYQGGSQIGSTFYSNEITLTTNWQLLTADYVVRKAGTTLSMRITNAGVSSGETFLVDDVGIELLPVGGAAAMATGLDAVEDPAVGEELNGESAFTFGAFVTPNPAHAEALLRFTTTRPGPIRAQIYDLSGRMMRGLLDESWVPAGRHAVRLGSAALRPGVYFYRVSGAEGTLQNRFVVLP